MKRLIQIGLLLALALPAYPQTIGRYVAVPLVSEDDNDSVGTYRYCVTTGVGEDVLGPHRPGNMGAKVKTTGSSATIDAVTASSGPFTYVSAGDELIFPTNAATPATGATDMPRGGQSFRYVLTRASADQITVNTAIDLSIPTTGYTFHWRKKVCGTGASDGWVPVAGLKGSMFTWEAAQSDAGGGVKVKVECEVVGAASSPQTLFEATYTTFPSEGSQAIPDSQLWDRCRIGMHLVTSDPSDAGAALEKLSAHFRGVR